MAREREEYYLQVKARMLAPVDPSAFVLKSITQTLLIGIFACQPLGGVDTYRIHRMIAARVTTAR